MYKLTEEQELLLENLREIYKRGNYEEYFKECDAQHQFPEKAAQDMVDAGFSLLGIPEKWGGTEAGISTVIMVCEEAHALGWPALTWVNHCLYVEDMLTFGNEEQQKTAVELGKKGIKPFTLGFTEPQAGSDSSAISTKAEKKNGKILINGQKTFNTSGDRSPWMLCVARNYQKENPYEDVSMYLVPLSAPGVKIRKLDKIGCNMTQTCEVYMDNVEIPESALVGVEGKGFLQLMKNFEIERVVLCASNIGMARCAYDEAVRYAGQRMQFGKKISDFQLIQEKITDMAIKIENMRNMIYRTAWKYENKISITIDASLCKRYTSMAAFEVIDDAMQIMGGIGYTRDSRISRLWRDQRVYRIMAGTDEIMVHATARSLVKEAMKKAGR